MHLIASLPWFGAGGAPFGCQGIYAWSGPYEGSNLHSMAIFIDAVFGCEVTANPPSRNPPIDNKSMKLAPRYNFFEETFSITAPAI